MFVLGFQVSFGSSGPKKVFGSQGPLSLSYVTTKTKSKLTQIHEAKTGHRVSGSKLGLIASLPLTCEVV